MFYLMEEVQRKQERERKNYVISKIKRISLSIDRSETWNCIILIGLLGVLVAGMIYYFL